MTKKDKEIMERENWSGKLDFLLSCIGFAVGLGNIWRFPYLCYKNGGGTFLIPYAIMLLIAGIPLFFLELSFGQFASQGPVTVWSVCPMFAGIGWAMVIISAMVAAYYNTIIMYSIYYMMVSFVSLDTELPWAKCDPQWATELCRQESYPDFASMTNETVRKHEAIRLKNTACLTSLLPNLSSALNMSYSSYKDLPSQIIIDNTTSCNYKFKVPSDEYWERFVLRLHEAEGFEDMGNLSLKLAVCFLLAWVVIFFCLMKGIKSSGKVVYFTATFPYLVLIALLVRGVTLEGSKKGIDFYMTPDWEKLKDAKVWGDAATQIFYSLGVAFGGLMTMSSYNRFHNNTIRDSLLVSLINCGTSVFAGFAVFSLLGFMAHQLNTKVEDVVDSGPGLIFIAYPEGIARMPAPAIWSFLFFFMVFTLGLDSQFAMMETVISGFVDVFPKFLRPRKTLFTLLCCTIGFLIGLPQVTKGGIYLLTLVNWYSGSYNLMIISLFELIALCYIYGINNFRKDIEMMVGKQNPAFWVYWYATWCCITPIAIIFIVIMSAVTYAPAYYGSYTFPTFAEVLGWLMVCAPLVCVVGGFVVQIWRYGFPGALKKRPEWGPALDEDRVRDSRYEPVKREFSDLSQNGSEKGRDNIAYVGHGNVKYIPNDDQTRM